MRTSRVDGRENGASADYGRPQLGRMDAQLGCYFTNEVGLHRACGTAVLCSHRGGSLIIYEL